MKYQSFIMRVLCLLLIVGVVLGYNSMQKKDSDTEKDQQIASLTTRVEALSLIHIQMCIRDRDI